MSIEIASERVIRDRRDPERERNREREITTKIVPRGYLGVFSPPWPARIGVEKVGLKEEEVGNDSGAPGSNTRQAQHLVRHCGLAAV